jgi:UDP-GlcNAc:undecaprenyl-phosphate GlcNAc-1-phosphate transferase
MWMWAALVAGSTVVISLYTGPLMWSGIGVAAVLTVVLTFLLPKLRRPGTPATMEHASP